MGLRCSLLGHDYGETTTERDREERGGEVVVVERDLEVCTRCGSERVLSENTEVRTLDSSPEQDDRAGEDADEDAEFQDAESFIAEATADASDDADPVDAEAADDADPDPVTASAEQAPAPADDDAVILEDDPGQERDTEQWPDEARQETLTDAAADETEADPSPWPEQEGEDEGFDAKPTSDDDEADVDFGGGLTPEVAEPGEADEEGYVEAPDDATGSADSFKTSGSPPPGHTADEAPSQVDDVQDTGWTSAGPVNPPSGSTDDADTVLVCPECGFERPAARASLRAGDICPECRRGYLAERR